MSRQQTANSRQGTRSLRSTAYYLLSTVICVLCVLFGEMSLPVTRAEEGLKDDGANLGPELLPQGDFEKGKDSPDGWDEVDDLTSFYVKRADGSGKEGKCLKFDSDVYNKEVEARKKEMKLAKKKRPRAKPKTKTTGKKYNTVAGGKGALLWSYYVEVEPGDTYRLVAQVKTYAPEVKIFVKGYAKVRGRMRIGYKKYLTCKPQDQNELGQWKFYTTDFIPQNPHNKKLKFKWIKVMIMVFWPPGEAYVDNISIRKILKTTKKDDKKGRSKSHHGGAENTEKNKGEKPKK